MSTKAKIITAVVVVIVIGVTAYFWNKSKKAVTPPATAPAAPATTK